MKTYVVTGKSKDGSFSVIIKAENSTEALLKTVKEFTGAYCFEVFNIVFDMQKNEYMRQGVKYNT